MRGCRRIHARRSHEANAASTGAGVDARNGAQRGQSKAGAPNRRRNDEVTVASHSTLTFALLAGLAVAGVHAAPAAGAIFRCDVEGGVTYTDEPCPHGLPLDIRAGTAAPDAAERLRRDREALDRGISEWRAAREREDQDRRLATAAAAAAARARLADAGPDEPVYFGAYDGLGYGSDGGARFGGRDGRRRNGHGDDRGGHGARSGQRVVPVFPPHSVRVPR